MVVGAQLYTVRELCQDEVGLAATLEQIAKIGYTSVQVSGIGPLEAEIVKNLCNRYNLRIVLTHTPPDEILNDTDRVIEKHKIMGADYVGIGAMPKQYERTIEGIDRFWSDFSSPAEKLSRAGLTLQYHNHHFELEKFSGKTLLAHLAQIASDELLGFIPDTYWLQYGGADPVEVIQMLSGRVPVVHLKDMTILNGQQEMAPVMSGNMNFPAILQACREAGTKWLMVEQDTCQGSPVDCLAESYHNLYAVGHC